MTAGYQGGLYYVNWTIYIDYNHDKDFNDANEEVAFGTSATTAAFTRYISIPSNALTGKTRMRIQMSYYGYEGPCGILSYGETEDYSININAAGKSITTAENMLTAKIEESKNSLSVAPNPVNSSNALISYSLQSNGKAQLRIIDMYGKAIQAIDLGMQKAGANTYKCKFARQLSPGIYIVLLEQNNQPVAQTKMLVTTGK